MKMTPTTTPTNADVQYSRGRFMLSVTILP